MSFWAQHWVHMRSTQCLIQLKIILYGHEWSCDCLRGSCIRNQDYSRWTHYERIFKNLTLGVLAHPLQLTSLKSIEVQLRYSLLKLPNTPEQSPIHRCGEVSTNMEKGAIRTMAVWTNVTERSKHFNCIFWHDLSRGAQPLIWGAPMFCS